MPFTRERMGADDFQVALRPETPQEIIDLANVNVNGTAHVVITPGDHLPGTIADADLLDQAMFVGVLLENTDGGYNLEGDGLHWYLGDDTDGGDCYTGADTDSGPLDLEAQLDAVVFNRSNGLTKGSVNSASGTKTIELTDGTTALALLRQCCRTYANPDYEYRINTDGTVDVNTAANLFTTTPEIILSPDGGRDGETPGLAAVLTVPDRSIRDFRTHLEVNWNNGTNNGTSSPGVPAGKNFVGFDGTDLVYRSSVQKSPKRSFRENPRRGDRFNAGRYSSWGVKSQTDAANMAASLASQAAIAWFDTQADIDEYDPFRFVEPGDYVWAHDFELGLLDTANEVYHGGIAVHPKKERVEAMNCPILPGYGVYLRVWDGAAFDWYRITPWVAAEDGPTTLELGVRNNLRRSKARPDRFNRRRYRRLYRDFFLLSKYLEKVT